MTEPTMKISAIAPWFGGKRNMAPEIVRELGPHSAYWEPFCGSMAVLLRKPVAANETVNDLHGDLINLARVIADDRQYRLLLRRLRRTLCVESIQYEARERLKAGDYTDAIDRAYDYFIESWLGRNGCAGTRSTNNGFCRRFTGSGGSPAKRLASASDSIPAWHRRLRTVTIIQMDALELLERVGDQAGTAIYVDSPYVTKACSYVHDFNPDDHRRLAELLRRFKRTRVVVSYYDHPLIRELYAGWTFRKIEVTKALVNQGMRDKGGAVKAPELLIINGHSLVEDDTPLLSG